MKCKHKWISLYYRKKTDKEYSSWIVVNDHIICQYCTKIARVEMIK